MDAAAVKEQDKANAAAAGAGHAEPAWLVQLRAIVAKPRTAQQQIAEDKVTFCLGLANLM